MTGEHISHLQKIKGKIM